MFLVKGILPTARDKTSAFTEILLEGSNFDTRQDILPELGIALSTTDAPITWEDAHGYVSVLRGYGKELIVYYVTFKFDTHEFGAEEFALLDGHRVAERIGLIVAGQVEDDDRPAAIYFMEGVCQELNYKPHIEGVWRNRCFGAAFFVPGARRGRPSKQPFKESGAEHVETRRGVHDPL
jgi:hypothetical protein